MSILAGAAAGVIVVSLMDRLSHHLYPLPADIAMPQTMEGWVELMKLVPAGALVVMLLGSLLAGIAAGIVTTLIAKEHKLRNAIIAAVVLTFLGAINAFAFPHPLWFRAGTLVAYIAGAYPGHLLIMKLRKNA